MGEKKKSNNNGGDDNKKKGDGNNNKKEETKPITVVLKVDMHCEGCASKVVKVLRSFDGVENVKAETELNKLTVTGTLDPSKIREMLQNKTKKNVNLISPQPKKDKDNTNSNNNNNNEKKDSKQDNKAEDKKSKEKEPPVTTAVLKLNLHCQGCIGKICRTVTKTKGVHDMSLDKQKDLVTVKGTMDVKALVETLKEKLKRPVEVVPLKKEKDGNKGGGGGEGGGDNNGGGKKKKGGGGGGGGQEEESQGGGKIEGNKMEYTGQPGFGFGFEHGYQYGHGFQHQYYPVQLHAPQMFSDENPNACSIM